MLTGNDITLVTPGTFHNFDVADELNKFNRLRQIYTLSDPLRIIKYKNKVPFNKIRIVNWYKNGNYDNRLNALHRMAEKYKPTKNEKILSMPTVSLEIYRKAPDAVKLLDIDHVCWSDEINNMVKDGKLKGFNETQPAELNEMCQNYILGREYNKRGIKYTPRADRILRELKEVQLADIVIVPVSYIYNAFLKLGVPKEKMKLLPYGYNHNKFFPNKFISEENNVYNVLYAGTISIRKGWYYLKDIVSEIIQNQKYVVSIAGSPAPEVKSDFEDFLDKNKCINYYGRVSQKKLGDIMRKSDVFLFPSVLEGYGLTILQAMACGLPVITTRITCGTDLIKNNKIGYIMDNYRPCEWFQAVEKLVYRRQNDREKVSKELRDVTSDLKWETYAKKLFKIING